MSTVARFTVAQYNRMTECGVFDPARQARRELLRGVICEKSEIGPLHEEVVHRLNGWSLRVLPEATFHIRVLCTIESAALESVAEPDLAWVAFRDYWDSRPTAEDVALVVEIAESGLAFYRGEKANLYSAAGIRDYWLVNLPERSIEVHRDPKPHRYGSLATYTGDDEVRPLAMPEIAIRPSALWEG